MTHGREHSARPRTDSNPLLRLVRSAALRHMPRDRGVFAALVRKARGLWSVAERIGSAILVRLNLTSPRSEPTH